MAFDARRPPEQELIEDCVHCGFCLPTCPTYALWGEEMDSPRGRIVLMRTGLEGTDLSEMSVHFDRCLGCMACVTACPSGVQYDRLIEATRPQVERNVRRSPRERLFRRLLFATMTRPAVLRALVAPLIAARRTRLTRALPARLRRLESFAPPVTFANARAAVAEVTPAAGTIRGRAGLLLGCVQRVFFPEVNRATVRVLAAAGFEVYAPARPGCCGALQLHAGEEDAALDRARGAIAAFEGCDHLVTNAAGCGSALKDYAHLLSDDPQWSERAAALSAKVVDVTELIYQDGPSDPRSPVELRVAYHDACHLAHAQGVRAQPRALLDAIPGLEIVEPDEWEICCGSAGVYNLLQPDAADDLGRRKAANLLATGADAVAAGNPGCALQIARFLNEAGRPLPIYHPVELLARSMEPEQRGDLPQEKREK